MQSVFKQRPPQNLALQHEISPFNMTVLSWRCSSFSPVMLDSNERVRGQALHCCALQIYLPCIVDFWLSEDADGIKYMYCRQVLDWGDTEKKPRKHLLEYVIRNRSNQIAFLVPPA